MSEPITLKYEEIGLQENHDLLMSFSDLLKDAGTNLKDFNKDLRASGRSATSASRGYDRLSQSANKAYRELMKIKRITGDVNFRDVVAAVGGSRSFSLTRSGGGRRRSVGDSRTSFDADAMAEAHAKILAKSIKPPPKIKLPKPAPDFTQKLNQLIGTSRIGIGANGIQAMPLINKILPMIEGSLGMAAGELIGPFTLAAGAVTLLAESAKMATQRLNTVGGLSIGSSPGAAYGAYRTAKALGLDPSSIGRSDAGIHQPGTAAYYYATRAGINPYRNAYAGSGYNDPENFMKEVKQILFDTSLTGGQRKAAAQGYGLEGILPYFNASPRLKKDLYQEMQKQADPKYIKEAADAQLQMNLALLKFEDIMVGIGQDVLPSINENLDDFKNFLTALDDGFKGERLIRDEVIEFFKFLGAEINDLVHLNLGGAKRDLKNYEKNAADMVNDIKNADKAKHDQALDRNTAATDRNTAALNWAGTFGGGERTRNATPRGWGVQGWQGAMDALHNQRIQMGHI